MASKATQHPARADKLPVVMTLEGHGPAKDNLLTHVFISYFPDDKQMFSGSSDGTSRRWNLETCREIDEARDVYEQNIWAVAVSRDGRWIVTGIAEDRSGDHPGEIKACNLETGVVKTFKGHSLPGQGMMMCIDISVDSKLLASGAGDGFRIWNLDTGQLLAGPSEFKTPRHHGVSAVRFSQDSTKLAVRAHGSGIEVWDILVHKLDVVTKSEPARGWMMSGRAPLFWTAKDRTLVATITWYHKSEDDDEDSAMYRHHPPNIIKELDASTLEMVSAPFEGHTDVITNLALSFDCVLLASASWHDGIKLWAFESRQLLASFNVHYHVCDLIFSPNSRRLVYSEFSPPTKFDQPKIYICHIPPNILARMWSEQEVLNVRICPHTSTSPVVEVLLRTIESEHSQFTDQFKVCDPVH
jgi:WD40 repeat protein